MSYNSGKLLSEWYACSVASRTSSARDPCCIQSTMKQRGTHRLCVSERKYCNVKEIATDHCNGHLHGKYHITVGATPMCILYRVSEQLRNLEKHSKSFSSGTSSYGHLRYTNTSL